MKKLYSILVVIVIATLLAACGTATPSPVVLDCGADYTEAFANIAPIMNGNVRIGKIFWNSETSKLVAEHEDGAPISEQTLQVNGKALVAVSHPTDEKRVIAVELATAGKTLCYKQREMNEKELQNLQKQYQQ